MAKPPIDLTRNPEYQRRQRERQAARQRRSELDAELGRQAFQSLLEYRGKLTPSDREAIARNLYWEVEDYWANHPDEERYLLLKDAGVTDENSTKVLPRLVLRPGEAIRANNGPYASPEKYRWLIEALARRSGESVAALAGRVLIGSAFYPSKADVPSPSINEAHLILAALQTAADRVDAEFHVYEQCMEVARIRDELESGYWNHVRETGKKIDYEAWQTTNPGLRLPSPCGPEQALLIDEDNALWWPLDHYLDEPDGQGGWRLIGPKNAFWAKGGTPSDHYTSQVESGKDFFYFPHAYLGPALCWGKTPRTYFFDASYDEIPGMPVPSACWDELSSSYSISEYEPAGSGTLAKEYDWDDLSANLAHWLVMYPDPALKRLVPMLYALGDSPGAQLTQLTASAIADLGNPEHWQYFGNDAPTLLQRLRDLTGFRSGTFDVYESWRVTAARFHLNPVLRRHPAVIDSIRYRKHLGRWIGQGPMPAGESDDEE